MNHLVLFQPTVLSTFSPLRFFPHFLLHSSKTLKPVFSPYLYTFLHRQLGIPAYVPILYFSFWQVIVLTILMTVSYLHVVFIHSSFRQLFLTPFFPFPCRNRTTCSYSTTNVWDTDQLRVTEGRDELTNFVVASQR